MSSYPLGMSPAEIARLERQHETWRAATEAAWRLAGIRPGQSIVDLGSGPGFTSIDLARIAGDTGRVVAVDASPAAAGFLQRSAALAGIRNLDVVTADAAAVDLAPYAPDVVFARWLFCYLPDPAAVLAQVATSLRPGGVVAIIDYWNYLAIRAEPASPLFATVFGAVYDSFRDAGGSLDVAGTLPSGLAAAGLTVRVVEPVSGVGRPGSAIWTWIAEFQDLYLPSLVERGYLTRQTMDEHRAWWNGLATTPGAFVFAPPMLTVVAAKP